MDLNSDISSRIWACIDGYLRLPEQYTPTNRFVGFLKLANYLLTVFVREVLVSVRYVRFTNIFWMHTVHRYCPIPSRQ